MDALDNHVIYVLSDSVGETAELAVKAAASQFRDRSFDIRRLSYVEDKGTIDEVIASAKEAKAMIAYTLVIPELGEYLQEQAKQNQLVAVDIIGPMIKEMKGVYHQEPRYEPGLVHKLDEDYFRRVEAIEFAVKYDDGRDPRGILRADIVLVGVSRTSKTPLSQYLAHKRLKVANVPLVPEVEPPEELFQINKEKCIGLKISAEKLNDIRKERLKSLGLDAGANYASLNRIKAELEYSERVLENIGCKIIDVTHKAVEETANIILDAYYKGKQ